MGLEQRTGLYGTYWGNTYNSSNTLTMEQMKVNASYIARYLQGQGWTINAIAGILGNMQSESAINPGRWQSDNVAPADPTYAGYGLVQWTPYTKYTNWVTGDPSTMDNNISRILYEVANNIQWGAGIYGTPPYSFSEFTHSTESAYDLAINFLKYYERPASLDYSRGTQAQAWYDYLIGDIPSRCSCCKGFTFY